MPINLFYELKKCEDISYADPLRPKSGGTRPLVPHWSTPMVCLCRTSQSNILAKKCVITKVYNIIHIFSRTVSAEPSGPSVRTKTCVMVITVNTRPSILAQVGCGCAWDRCKQNYLVTVVHHCMVTLWFTQPPGLCELFVVIFVLYSILIK